MIIEKHRAEGMSLGNYEFSLVFETEASLPPFKGSTFRGVFGVALRRVVCALRLQDCKDCILRDNCVYFRAFECQSSDLEKGAPQCPHPFVIEPPLTESTFWLPGEGFPCHLLLFGWANEMLPYFVYAFQQMGSMGIGKRIKGVRGEFKLVSVACGNQVIYESESGKLLKTSNNFMCLPDFHVQGQLARSVRLALETPVRLKIQNKLQADLPFHVLTRAMLRRISLLNECFGSGEPNLDYRGLVAKAERIRTSESSLRWFDWRRYSNRQETEMLMGGIIGEVAYDGDLTPFLPLLRYCETVHLGKATTFGLGKIRILEVA